MKGLRYVCEEIADKVRKRMREMKLTFPGGEVAFEDIQDVVLIAAMHSGEDSDRGPNAKAHKKGTRVKTHSTPAKHRSDLGRDVMHMIDGIDPSTSRAKRASAAAHLMTTNDRTHDPPPPRTPAYVYPPDAPVPARIAEVLFDRTKRMHLWAINREELIASVRRNTKIGFDYTKWLPAGEVDEEMSDRACQYVADRIKYAIPVNHGEMSPSPTTVDDDSEHDGDNDDDDEDELQLLPKVKRQCLPPKMMSDANPTRATNPSRTNPQVRAASSMVAPPLSPSPTVHSV